MRKVTNSEITTFRRCKRKWYLSQYRSLALQREERVSAASLGTLVHLGLEQHYLGQNALYFMQARIDMDREALVLEEGPPDRLKKFDKQAALALTMVEGYIDWLEESGADADLEFIATERAVEVEILPGVMLLGKLDAKVRRRSTGEELFLDQKTVQSIESTAESAYRSSQFRTYALLEYLDALTRNETPGTSGVIVSMLRKVGRGATARPPFYGREQLSFNTTMLRNHWLQVVSEIERIQDTEARLTAGESHHVLTPPNPTRDCSWDCPFTPICPQMDDGSDVESVISFAYVVRSPLARYGDADETEAGE